LKKTQEHEDWLPLDVSRIFESSAADGADESVDKFHSQENSPEKGKTSAVHSPEKKKPLLHILN